jgi:methylaspartate mutase sigma subunit
VDELNIVLTAMASDSHTWNLIYLELLLKEWGHEVTNLGPCVPEALLLRRCRDLEPDLIVISSVNGLGFGEGKRVIDMLRRDAEFTRTPVVIGGKLGTGEEDQAREAAALAAAGFDLVVSDADGLAPFHRFVESMCMRAVC